AFRRRPGQRLLTEHMLPELEGANRNVGVRIRRGADDDRVNIFTRHRLLPACAGLAVEVTGQALRVRQVPCCDDDLLSIFGSPERQPTAPALQSSTDDRYSHCCSRPSSSRPRATYRRSAAVAALRSMIPFGSSNTSPRIARRRRIKSST